MLLKVASAKLLQNETSTQIAGTSKNDTEHIVE